MNNINSESQLGKVFAVVQDGTPRTLSQISSVTGFPQASVSARLRDLRKSQFGKYTVSRVATKTFVNGRYVTVFKYAVKETVKKSRR